MDIYPQEKTGGSPQTAFFFVFFETGGLTANGCGCIIEIAPQTVAV
jgi:hypothetical protein